MDGMPQEVFSAILKDPERPEAIEYIDLFNKWIVEQPQDIQNLIWFRVRMERDFVKGLRCGVCASYKDPDCATRC